MPIICRKRLCCACVVGIGYPNCVIIRIHLYICRKKKIEVRKSKDKLVLTVKGVKLGAVEFKLQTWFSNDSIFTWPTQPSRNSIIFMV
jgi:hypothetical protein